MIEALIYPVSGVMKLWHVLLHNICGLSDSRAWLLSIFGLIITVRSIVLPLYWKQMKNSRISLNIRPQVAALRQEYALISDPAKKEELKRKRKELYKKANYSPAAGCLPILIQLPVFIGLYRMMLYMARPAGGIEASHYRSIGLLSADEVKSFLDVRISGVPVPAYVAMSAEQFEYLGTSYSEVRTFVFPLLVCASLFTGINMLNALFRNLSTMDFSSRSAKRSQIIMLPIMLFAVSIPLKLGLHGPFPVAIAIYWFGNNLWTLTQATTAAITLHYRYPLTEEFHAHRKQRHAQYRKLKAFNRERTWGLRRRRVHALFAHGATKERLRAEIAEISQKSKAFDENMAARKAEAKAAARALRSAKKQARAQAKARARGENLNVAQTAEQQAAPTLEERSLKPWTAQEISVLRWGERRNNDYELMSRLLGERSESAKQQAEGDSREASWVLPQERAERARHSSEMGASTDDREGS